MQNNGTIWAHIFFTKAGKKPVPNSKDIILQKTVCKCEMIIDDVDRSLTLVPSVEQVLAQAQRSHQEKFNYRRGRDCRSN